MISFTELSGGKQDNSLGGHIDDPLHFGGMIYCCAVNWERIAEETMTKKALAQQWVEF